VDIAKAAAIEVARGRMVHGVILAPAIVRCQSQHREGAADHIICSFGLEEGAVSAVVLENE
jgi:hypothetical protein